MKDLLELNVIVATSNKDDYRGMISAVGEEVYAMFDEESPVRVGNSILVETDFLIRSDIIIGIEKAACPGYSTIYIQDDNLIVRDEYESLKKRWMKALSE